MQKSSCTKIIPQLLLDSDISSVCTFLCSVLLPSSRHPAKRALRHPYHSRTIHHRQRAQTHRQPILRHLLHLCSRSSVVPEEQILRLRKAGSLSRIQVQWQVWRNLALFGIASVHLIIANRPQGQTTHFTQFRLGQLLFISQQSYLFSKLHIENLARKIICLSFA